jgi:DNA-binding transcriptional LysR family regulator
LSFSRAAVALNLSQPAVSKHIRLLEAELGVRLFQRLGNRVELTEAGRLLGDYARRLTVLTDEVRRVLGELEGLQRGGLRIGASTTPGLYLLPETLAHFRARYPGIETTLTITNSADIVRRVAAGELELGYVGTMPEGAGLQARPIQSDEIALVVPAGHRLTPGRGPAAGWLEQETLIVREPGSGTQQAAEAALTRLGLKPKARLELTGSEAVKRAVAAGLGVAFISRRAIMLEVQQGLVAEAPLPVPRSVRPLTLINRKDARPSAAALAFMALMQKGDHPAP